MLVAASWPGSSGVDLQHVVDSRASSSALMASMQPVEISPLQILLPSLAVIVLSTGAAIMLASYCSRNGVQYKLSDMPA